MNDWDLKLSIIRFSETELHFVDHSKVYKRFIKPSACIYYGLVFIWSDLINLCQITIKFSCGYQSSRRVDDVFRIKCLGVWLTDSHNVNSLACWEYEKCSLVSLDDNNIVKLFATIMSLLSSFFSIIIIIIVIILHIWISLLFFFFINYLLTY